MTLRKAAFLLYLAMLGVSAHAQLACTFGNNGLATVTYNGVSLENTANGTFTVTHMQLEDLSGNLNETSGQVNSTNSWNSSTNTKTYTFSWGTVSVAHSCTTSAINLTTTIVNNSGSGVVFDGLEIMPFTLTFPSDPNGFYGYTQFAIDTLNPPVSIADYGTGMAANVMPNAKVTLLSGTATNLTSEYSGWVNVGTAAYSPMMTTTLPAEGPSFFPNLGLGLQPGSSASYTNSIRFSPEGTSASSFASDAFASYRQAFPYQAVAGTHKAIGTMYFSAGSGSSNLSVPGDANINNPYGCGANSGNPNNYKEYYGATTCTANVATGGDGFQDMVLHRAADIVSRSATYGYWGTVTWDIEGQKYPQNTSYVCSPDQLDTIAPEMDQAVNDSNYPAYSGVTNPATGQVWRLVDAYFDMQIKAGLSIGVCIRPDTFTAFTSASPDPNAPGQTAPAGSATQVFPTNSAAGDQATANLMISKIQYVKNRWGGGKPVLAYIDSMVYANGQVINPNVLQKVSAAFPNDVLMPEAQHGQVEIRNWAYAKQFLNLEDNNDEDTTSVDPAYDPRLVYPQASSAVLVNDMNSTTLQNDQPTLTTAVAAGDDLMGHADYDHPNSNTIVSIYQAAAQQAPTPTATQATCTPANGNKCWYVRADGGTRWSSARASNNISAQCNGQADVSYAAAFAAAGSPATIPSGGLSCAFNDLRFMWDDAVTYNSISSVMSGGDTLIIGDTTNAYQSGENAWRVGYDRNSSTGAPITNAYPVWCRGIGYCYMAKFPTGTAANPTHVWGRNKGICSVNGLPDKTKLTRISGGENAGADFTADGAYLDVQCVELTPEHSSMAGRGTVCGQGSYTNFTSPNGATPPPTCNGHPEYDGASQGLTVTNTSYLTLTDAWIHNNADSGIKGPYANLSLERVIVESNNSAGLNSDNGCDTTATEPNTTTCMSNVMPAGAIFSLDHSLVTGNGCIHTVPYTGETGWIECSDQSHGGYGDGIGTAACLQFYPDGTCHYGQHPNVSITNSILRYNVQDGEDFGHVDGDDGQTLNFTFTNSLSYGNGGGQIKFGWGYDKLTIINNVLLANCARLAYPFQGQSSSFFNPMAGSGQDLGLCRSGDFFSFNVNNNTVANIDHNTFVGYPPTFFDYKCVTIEALGGTGSSPQPNCDNAVINLRNNIIMGYANYDFLHGPNGGAYGGNSAPAPYCGASCNNSTGNGNDGGLIGTWNSSNNLYYGLRSCPANQQRPSTKSGTSTNEQCIDPLLVNEPLANVTGSSRVADPVDAMFDGYNFAITAGPAKAAGIAVTGETADYTGANYASTPAIGGMEYGSTATAVVPLNTVTSVSVPVASPAPGTITAPTSLTLTCPSGFSGCSIYYTTDGFTTPTNTSTLYTGPISISKTTTVKAIAVASGYSNSAVSTLQYTLNAVVNFIVRGLHGFQGCKGCHI